MRHSDRRITAYALEEQRQAVNANGNSFTSLKLGLRFDLNPDSINYIWGNSMREDCVGECSGGRCEDKHTGCWVGLQLKSVNIKAVVS